MLALSEETETLARRLAEAQKLPVDLTIRRALEAQAQSAGVPSGSGRLSDEEIAQRKAALRDLQAQIAALPILDPRSPEEIMDELNEL